MTTSTPEPLHASLTDRPPRAAGPEATVPLPAASVADVPPKPDLAGPMLAEAEDARSDRDVQTVSLLILAIIAVGFALFVLRPVLVPFVLAVFLSYCLAPVIEFLQKYLRFTRSAAVVGAAVVGLLGLGLAGGVVAFSVAGMSKNFGQYQQRIDQLNHRIVTSAPLHWLGVKPTAQGMLVAIPETATVSFVSTVLSEATQFASSSALVVIFMIFILLGTGRPRAPGGLLGEVEARVRRYLNATVFLSVLTGVLVAGILAALGVEFAGVFGLLAFLLNFIPSVGAIIATLLPLPIVLLAPDLSPEAKVMAIALPAALQFVMGIIQPRVQGDAMELHPVAILMALIFFGMIWGLVGAFLATPITAVIRIILERIPQTRPLALLLAGDLTSLADRSSGTTRR